MPPYYPGIVITPNLGLSLIGMDEVVAQDMILIDAAIGSGGGGITLQTNGVNNTLQTKLNLIAGSNITLTPNALGGVTVAASGGGTVTSVFGRTGAVVAVSGDYTVGQITGAAPLASPTFTGTPAAPTAAPGTNTTQIATTAFVTAAIAAGGTVTSVSFTGGLISVANPTTTPALTVAGTSGGTPYFSSTSTWASSALLASGGLVLGGGAGNPPLTNTQLTFSAPTLTVGLAGTSSGILALTGSTSGTATFTAPAIAGTVSNPVVSSNAIQVPGAGGLFVFSGRTQLSSAADGNLAIENNAGTDFGRLQFGGTTSSFPAIKRNSAALNVRLADDSADAAITAATAAVGTNTTQLATTAFVTAADVAGTVLNSADLGYFYSTGILQVPYASATAVAVVAAGQEVRAFQFILPVAMTIGRATVRNGAVVVGATLTVGIYSSSGSKLIDSGTYDCGVNANPKTNTFGAVTLPPGVYYFAHSGSTQTTLTANCLNNTNAFVFDMVNNQTTKKWGIAANAATAGVLPATLGAITANDTIFPMAACFER